MSELRRNEITLDEIFERIDDAIEEKSNIMFVVNFALAKEISEYLDDEFGIEDEHSQLYEEDLDEYYVSLYFDEDGIHFYCESAKGNSGEFKLSDCGGIIDYYIFLEMSEEEINEKLQGEGVWGLYDVAALGDDIENLDISCEDCNKCEDNDEDDAEFEMLANWAEKIVENDLCFGCVFNIIADAYYTGKKIGARDSKLEMIETLGKEVEYLD
jgi:hypothetical protein